MEPLLKLPSLNALKKILEIEIEDELLWPVLLDLTRVSDKKITEHIGRYKKNHGLKLTSIEKTVIRLYLLGLSSQLPETLPAIDCEIFSVEDYSAALELVLEGIDRNKAMLSGTIRSRLLVEEGDDATEKYAKIIAAKEKGQAHFALILAERKLSGDEGNFQELVKRAYRELANYHYIAVCFTDATWSQVARAAVFMESFETEPTFKLFERTKQSKIDELTRFVAGNPNIQPDDDLHKQIQSFYQHVRAGFVFEDLLVVDDSQTKVLIMQKIKLDDDVIPCPDCLSTQVRGNSYPKMLLRSFECHNPTCKSRSKIGRGKRYDLFNVKRNLKLRTATPLDEVPRGIRQMLRRDVLETDLNLLDAIFELYTWRNDRINTYSLSAKAPQTFVENREMQHIQHRLKPSIASTPALISLLGEVLSHKKIREVTPRNRVQLDDYSLYNGNSTELLCDIPETISHAMTSPPYYNAREYSQWPTLICYLIDMGLSAVAIYNKLEESGLYIYNIGDIVGQDNVYVSSHMSNKRLMLGFYSIVLFELIGYKTIGNVIWDKGEVQSKRNSTDNPFPTYLRPINAYEHCIVFGKNTDELPSLPNVLRIDPVRKINSKGENILGHTAPYPEKLVQAFISWIATPKGHILDPFVGSGTTVIACVRQGLKAVGVELDSTYFELCKTRIENELNKPQPSSVALF